MSEREHLSAAVLQDLYHVAQVELIYRRASHQREGPLVNSSLSASDILRSTWDENKLELCEQFKILLLDTAGRCLGVSDMCSGGISGCVVDPRLIFATALKANATQIILAHNHPSGNTRPSEADKRITEKIVSGGRLLDITVSDHLILTRDAYLSFADEGLMLY